MSSNAAKLAEYRRQQAERYKSLSAEERPHVAECPDCHRPVHVAKVCCATGLLHEREKMKLIGGVAVSEDKMGFNGRELMSALDASRVKWQKARVSTIRIDSDASAIFQSFPLRHTWKLMRFGVLYGTFDPITKVVSAHCVYEPEQKGDHTGYQLLSDPREERVNNLAQLLGMQRVGIIVTHPPRDSNEVVLSAVELLLCARDQSRFGDHCVVITVAPEASSKQITAQGWQVTEQCVRLFQMGVLSPSPDLGFVASSIALEVAKEEKDAKGRPQCVVKEPANTIDTRFMTGFCAIEQFHSEVVGNLFARISRANEPAPTAKNLDVFFKDAKRVNKPFHAKVADFHALVFIMELMFQRRPDDLKAMVECILKADDVGLAKFEREILAKIRG